MGGKTGNKNVKGLVLGGRYGEVLARQKSDEPFEIGELLIAEDQNTSQRVLMQVYDLLFGSQVSQQNRELISGMALEEDTEFEFLDPHLRQYTLAVLKEMLLLDDKNPVLAKGLPGFFSQLRAVKAGDFSFLEKPKNPLYIGQLRSGSKVLEVPVKLDGRRVLSHHVLIPATTGRGKSNLLKVLLWSAAEDRYCGSLVLDPHDEYYRPDESLRAHPARDNIVYYSPDPLPGTNSLIINLKQLRPSHLEGCMDWSTAQREALQAYHNKFKENWISEIFRENDIKGNFNESTIGVVRRRIVNLLNLEFEGEKIIEKGIFKSNTGESTINDVVDALEQGKTVIVDTSAFSGAIEILIGSVFSSEVLRRYKQYKNKNTLSQKPVISIVLEEAPRVLGKEVLERGPNIFSTIAREGRKFQIGLLAITQLPSLIPRQILANMNTKIVLGIEMRPERQAIIDSAAQDLSQDDRAIASLDKGEAIITTNFAPFALPVKVPLFSDFIAGTKKVSVQKSFPGLKE
ncbi:DUF87 domain-containing protein [Candidatus Woesearchaeota archaeon]|nr:DUF87 domain-containing protein [Candidatus Woesearchaeota archaeon]